MKRRKAKVWKAWGLKRVSDGDIDSRCYEARWKAAWVLENNVSFKGYRVIRVEIREVTRRTRRGGA